MATTAGKGITVDDDFLRKFLARGGAAATPTGTPVGPDNISQFLGDEATAHKQVEADAATKAKIDAATQNDKAARLHTKVEEQQARNAEKDEQAALKRAEQEKRDQEIERDAQIRAAATLAGKAKGAVTTALAPAQGVADRIASARTGPGGVAFLIVVIALLLFTVVQVNAAGDTRMKLLWYLLNGRTALAGRKLLTHTPGIEQQTATDFKNIGTAAEQVIGDLTGVAPGTIGGIGAGIGAASGLVPLVDFTPDFRNLP